MNKSFANHIGLLSLILFLLTMGSLQAAGPEGDGFDRSYKWKYEGRWYTFSYNFSWDLYNFYQEKPRAYENYAVYTYEHPKYAFIGDFAEALQRKAKANGLNDWQTIQFMIAFVQQLEYVTESGEYPKFPVETLADKGGDCEDTSILLATMLGKLGYDAVLINPPGHMAMGLACVDCEGTAYHRNGRKYFYVETTGAGFDVGQVPREYETTRDKVMTLNVKPSQFWLLAENVEPPKSDNPSYYVMEDKDTRESSGREGRRVITQTTMRTVTIDGQTWSTTTVTRQRKD